MLWSRERLEVDWDEAIIARIARHRVTPDEVESALANNADEMGYDEADDELRWLSWM